MHKHAHMHLYPHVNKHTYRPQHTHTHVQRIYPTTLSALVGLALVYCLQQWLCHSSKAEKLAVVQATKLDVPVRWQSPAGFLGSCESSVWEAGSNTSKAMAQQDRWTCQQEWWQPGKELNLLLWVSSTWVTPGRGCNDLEWVFLLQIILSKKFHTSGLVIGR